MSVENCVSQNNQVKDVTNEVGVVNVEILATPYEPVDEFLKRIDANPKLAGQKGDDQNRLIYIVKNGYLAELESENEEGILDPLLKKRIKRVKMATDLLIQENMGFVTSKIASFNPNPNNWEDFEQLGRFALYKAIKTFNFVKYRTFSTYAIRIIENEFRMNLGIFEGTSRNTRSDRINILHIINEMKEGGVSIDYGEISIITGIKEDVVRNIHLTSNSISLDSEILVNSKDGDTSALSNMVASDVDVEKEVIDDLRYKNIINNLRHILNEREYMIFKLLNGIETDGIVYTQKEVAEMLGISRSNVSRLQKMIYKRISEKYNSGDIIGSNDQIVKKSQLSVNSVPQVRDSKIIQIKEIPKNKEASVGARKAKTGKQKERIRPIILPEVIKPMIDLDSINLIDVKYTGDKGMGVLLDKAIDEMLLKIYDGEITTIQDYLLKNILLGQEAREKLNSEKGVKTKIKLKMIIENGLKARNILKTQISKDEKCQLIIKEMLGNTKS